MNRQSVAAFAPAKVNLALHVTGQRSDGYHLLDSLVMFADFGDHLTVSASDAPTMSVTGPLAQGVPTDATNLCLRAAAAFGETVNITLDKHLPAGAGIGGGSSDAAAVLRAMETLFGRPFHGHSADLGADVPVCVYAKAARMQGIGDQITPVQMPSLPAVLVNPRVHVPTPAVFRALTTRDNPAMTDPVGPFDDVDAALSWIGAQRNDMQDAAISVQPVIETVLTAITRTASQCTRMSGSGATCFGLYPTFDDAKTAAADLAAMYPDWWVQAVTLS